MPSPERFRPPRVLAAITTHEFLRIELRLFRGEKSPPRPRARPEVHDRYPKISEEHARRVLELLLRSFAPGDQVGARDVQRITQWSESHSRGAIRRLKELEVWPFAPPPETRGRKPKSE